MTDMTQVWEELAWQHGGKIVYLILDGLGGIPDAAHGGKTELQVAHTPNLDAIAKKSSCGLLDMVGPGITPGSGPGHLTLFGYNPITYRIGRGVLSALGIEFELQEGDVAARVNFATLGENGEVRDRRAGRIETDLNQQLCQKIRDKVSLDFDGTFFFETVSEHRAVFVLRGKGLSGALQDTDPQTTGRPPLEPHGESAEADKTVELVRSFLDQVHQVLADEQPANAILMRGFEQYHALPSLEERFGLRGVCIADYPMYRGVSRLVGMEVLPRPGGMEQRFKTLEACYGDEYDFYFLHVKKTDSKGEDGNFDGKVHLLEEIDRLVPTITNLEPDVLVVASDHSTPATMGQHSWHPVPVMLQSKLSRVDQADCFDEFSCILGALGQRPGLDIMGLALAHAQRLRKFGA